MAKSYKMNKMSERAIFFNLKAGKLVQFKSNLSIILNYYK